MFEYNVRASTVLGFVGAGGVGFLMINYIETLRYSSLTTIIILTLTVVVAVDYVSGRLRKMVLPEVRLKTPHKNQNSPRTLMCKNS
jgi:phosphonate transport system permease protein